jgi:hypothetical protein
MGSRERIADRRVCQVGYEKGEPGDCEEGIVVELSQVSKRRTSSEVLSRGYAGSVSKVLRR